jgi:TM2 domain-containing membrane protein YozV
MVGDFALSKKYFSQIKGTSECSELSKLELMKILFLEGNFSDMRKYSELNGKINLKLYMISFLKDREIILERNDFLIPFGEKEKPEAAELYQNRVSPEKKNPLLASLISAIIPGSGKIYTGEITDGIFALLATGLFTFLAYDNFKADHTFRGWLFSGLAAGFYAGNVYGSYASAQIFNARVSYEFNLRLDLFLRTHNYFVPENGFCE